MWQLWFVYWAFFNCCFNRFLFPNHPFIKGSIWMSDWRCLSVHACWQMLIFWVRTELVDIGSESPRVTCSTTFCSWLLLLTLQLLLPIWLFLVSPPLLSLVSPISHSSSLSQWPIPQAFQSDCFMLCHARVGVALQLFVEKFSCLKYQCSWRGVVMLHLLGLPMLVFIFIQEGG